MTQPISLKKNILHAPMAQSPGPHVDRHGHYPKGTRLEPTTTPVSPRRKVRDFPPGWLPERLLNHLEHNQKIASCCRHPENHEIEGLKSHPDEPVSDIYIFHCDCGRKHRIFCVGFGDQRPEWG